MTPSTAAHLRAIVATALLVVGVTDAEAVVITTGCANTNQSCTLQELFDGGTITVDDKLFAEFGFESAFPVPGPDPTGIDVVPLDTPGNPGLRFVGNGELAISGPGVLDFAFNFSVSTTTDAALIVDNTLALTGFAFSGDGGRIVIDETVFDTDFVFLHDKRVEADQVFGTFDLTDTATFAPQARLLIEKDISVTGDFVGETVSLISFEQRFSQLSRVPEPASLTLVGLGLVVGLGVREWRRRTAIPERRKER